MNAVESLVQNFQELVAQVPESIQPLIVLLAGAVPFIEGEGGVSIGIVGGINPVLAGLAAAAGNFLCVLIVVLLGSRVRSGVVNRRAGRAEASRNAAPPAMRGAAVTVQAERAKPESKGRLRFRKWLVQYGVPGASLLGPLAIPTQFTSAMLVAAGNPRGWVLLWQAVAIVLWTTLTTTLVWIAYSTVIAG